MNFREDVFEVTAKIIANGEKLITTTFRSGEGYDRCHQKIENWINKNIQPGAAVETHILNTAHFTVPGNY